MDVLGWVTVGLAVLAVALLMPPPHPPVRGRGRSLQSLLDRPVDDAGGPGDGADTRWTRLAVSSAAALGAWVLVPGWTAVPLGGAVAVVAWWLAGRREPRSVRRRREELAGAVPHVVDLMAAALAVGASPVGAMTRIAGAVEGPVREELAAVTARLELGADPVEVWRGLSRHPELGAVGRTLLRAAESGASVSEAMRRLADDLRRRRRAEGESRARAVGVKASAPLGLCLLPAFVLVGVVPLVAASVSALLGR